MLYKVVDTTFQTDDIDEVIRYCIDEDYYDDVDDALEEWVNDLYESAHYFGHTYSPYEILDAMNDLDDARDQFVEERLENDRENAEWELRHADDGETVYIQKYEVECLAEDENTGDTDGDEYMNVATVPDLETLRESIQKALDAAKAEAEQDRTENMMYSDLFQTIGG